MIVWALPPISPSFPFSVVVSMISTRVVQLVLPFNLHEWEIKYYINGIAMIVRVFPFFLIHSLPSEMFGVLIKSCYVTDGFGKRAEVIDNNGYGNFSVVLGTIPILSIRCPVDPILITGIRYSSDLQRGYAESQVNHEISKGNQSFRILSLAVLKGFRLLFSLFDWVREREYCLWREWKNGVMSSNCLDKILE